MLRSLANPAADADGTLRAELEAWMRRAGAAGMAVEDIDALVTDVRDQLYEKGATTHG